MTGIPIWLLDVDGVLNASKPEWHEAPFRQTVTYGDEEFVIRWAPQLIKRIRDLVNAGTVEVRWCTTWCAQADRIEKAMGLPPLLRAFTHEVVTREEAKTAKINAVADALATGRRVVWTDDIEVTLFGHLYADAERSGRILMIAPYSRSGITPDQMNEIEKFICT